MGCIIFQSELNNIEGTQQELIARCNNFCVLSYYPLLHNLIEQSLNTGYHCSTIHQKKKKINEVIMLIVLNLCSNISLPSIKFGNRTFPKLSFFFKNSILLILIFQVFVIYGELVTSLHSNLCSSYLLPA